MVVCRSGCCLIPSIAVSVANSFRCKALVAEWRSITDLRTLPTLPTQWATCAEAAESASSWRQTATTKFEHFNRNIEVRDRWTFVRLMRLAEVSTVDWANARFKHVVKVRQALIRARLLSGAAGSRRQMLPQSTAKHHVRQQTEPGIPLSQPYTDKIPTFSARALRSLGLGSGLRGSCRRCKLIDRRPLNRECSNMRVKTNRCRAVRVVLSVPQSTNAAHAINLAIHLGHRPEGSGCTGSLGRVV